MSCVEGVRRSYRVEFSLNQAIRLNWVRKGFSQYHCISYVLLAVVILCGTDTLALVILARLALTVTLHSTLGLKGHRLEAISSATQADLGGPRMSHYAS